MNNAILSGPSYTGEHRLPRATIGLHFAHGRMEIK